MNSVCLKLLEQHGQQLKAMLDREIGIYLGGSLVIALVFGSILSVIVCRRLDAVNHCITLVLPWLFLLALVVCFSSYIFDFHCIRKIRVEENKHLVCIRRNDLLYRHHLKGS